MSPSKMKLEQQVVSLELSKKLRELEVKQESYFWWYRAPGDVFCLGDSREMMSNGVQMSATTAPMFENYAAFTVAELGEMLPYDYLVEISKRSDETFNLSLIEPEKGYTVFVEDGTEADVRAKMLIYLIENNLITP